MHIFGVHRQNQYWLARKLLLDVAEQIEATAAGHGKVEDRHVPLELAGELERFVPVGRFTYDGRCGVGRQHLLETVAHDRMIVGYENSHCIPLVCSFPVAEEYRHLNDAWPSSFPFFVQGCSAYSTGVSVFSRHVLWHCSNAIDRTCECARFSSHEPP